MEATSIQRSPSCGVQGGRRRASSGTPRLRAGLGRVAGHHGREGMRGVDHRLDPLLLQEAGEPLHAAEAADAGRDRQRAAGRWCGRPWTEAGLKSELSGQKRRERGGFRRAAQNEDAHGLLFL